MSPPEPQLPLFDPGDREVLQADYLALCRSELPARAAREGWPLRLDHCFARVILDEVFDDVWYAHVTQRPAYRALSTGQLRRALAIGRSILDEGRERLEELNRRSLRRRGK